MIVSWPGHIKDAGALRTQFHHVVDIAPTVFEIAGVNPPDTVNGVKQMPLEGTSMVYTFDHPDEPSHHKTQYFEMLGSRGIYHDGWWAGSFHHLPWQSGPVQQDRPTPENNPWELYDLDQDYSQAHDLVRHRGKKDPLPGRSTGPGVARLTINGKPAGDIANFGESYGETLDIGSDLGSPVSSSYTSPFAFTGRIETVTLELL